MHIEELIIDGFKSYANKTVITDWDTCFNAITGLNGSGKSNILDAICFVLGIDNLKQVRAQNLQDLIYKRGQAGISRATVTAVFNNEDSRKSPLGYADSKKIIVSRQIILGGKTKYLLNGHVVPAKNIDNLFSSVGLNINHPNFLILQGQITKVLNMNSQEILGLIEEAAGTAMYEDRKDRALLAMAKKEKKLEEIQNLLTETITPKLEQLRKERNSFLLYSTTQAEVEKLGKLSLWNSYKECVKDFKILSLEDESRTLTLNSIQETASRLNEKLQENENSLAAVNMQQASTKKERQKLDLLESDMKKFTDEINQLQPKIELSKNTYKENFSNIKGLQHSEKEAIQKVKDCENQLQKLKDTKEIQRLSLEDKKTALNRLEELVSSLSTGISSSEGSQSGYLQYWKAVGNDLKEVLISIEKNKNLLEESKRDLLDKRSKAVDSKTAITNMQGQISQLQNELEMAKQNANSLVNDMSDFDLAYAHQKESSLRIRLESYNKKYLEFQPLLDSITFHYDLPSVDHSLIKGYVAKLFKIPSLHAEWADAIETVAGGKLYFVIVENEAIGSQLLQHGNLRKRISIIPLNDVVPNRITKAKIDAAKKKHPGKVDIATNLINYDKSLQPAMDFVFGSTLLCKDKETANAIAFDPNFAVRCITIDGDVYDPQGTLTGGSKSNKTGLLTKLAKLHELELEMTPLKNELSSLQALSSEFEEKKALLKNLQTEIEVKEHNLKIASGQLSSSAASMTLEKIFQLETTIAKCKNENQLLLEKKARLEAELQKAEAEMSQNNPDRDRNMKNLKEELEVKKKEFKKLSLDYSKIEKSLSDWNIQLETLSESLSSICNKKASLENSNQLIEVELVTFEKVYSEANEKYIDASEQYERAKISLKNFTKEAQQLQDARMKIEESIEQTKLEEKKILAEVERGKRKLNALKDNIENFIKEDPWLLNPQEIQLETNLDMAQVIERLSILKSQLNSLKSTVNTKVMDMIDRVETKESSLRKMLTTVKKDKLKIENTIKKLNDYQLETLFQTWKKVNVDFGEIFTELLPGATAKLEPVNDDNMREGIAVKVGLGGVWKESLTELSGGQRSLVALSLILSMLKFNPAPVYILDEVDAALDPSHTQNLGSTLTSRRFNNAQFIIVSLKDGLWSNANVLFKANFVEGSSTVETIFNYKNKK